MGDRYTFKCWNPECKREYTLFREITDEQVLIVACPYCDKEAIVRLANFPKKTTVYRGDATQEAPTFEYQFPDVIPTQKPD